MAEPNSRQSFAELLETLTSELPDLFRKEIRLVKVEASEGLDLLLAAFGRLALGSAAALGAIGVLLAALVSWGTTFLVARGMEPALAGSLAATIVAGVAAIASWVLLAGALRAVRSARSSLRGSVDALTASATNIAEKF